MSWVAITSPSISSLNLNLIFLVGFFRLNIIIQKVNVRLILTFQNCRLTIDI